MHSRTAGIVTGWGALLATGAQAAASATRDAGVLLAQAQPRAEGVVTTSSGRSYALPIFVTLALFGLALWVVCKSSRRV